MKKAMALSAARRFISVLVAGALAGVPAAHATDAWEPDNSSSDYLHYLVPGHAPELHDLQAISGVADVDMYYIITRPYRSYEARIETKQRYDTVSAFARLDYSFSSVLQSAVGWAAPGIAHVFPFLLRWEVGTTGGGNAYNGLRVTGQTIGTATSVYSIVFRETTLFCPRFNNASSQVSVLMVQAALDGSNSCQYSAHFFDEGGSLLATQTGSFPESFTQITPLNVISLPGVSGLAGQKGSAQISHTCGYGNLKAKLVALEPATGFSFDTQCTVREQ